MTTHDNSSRMANYWWKDFLELEVVRKDNVNTKKAFDTIVREIINPIKNISRQDHLNLWNITLGFFKLEGEFSLDYYRDEIIGNYCPYDKRISITDLQTKCNRLPERGGFDQRFVKDASGIKGKQYKKIITLTNEIDLTLKDYVANLPEVLQPYINDAEEKFLMIKSPEGFEYAKNLRDNANNE
jgi:hypothetical protein